MHLNRAIYAIGSFGYAGSSPVMPGTVGSVVAAVLFTLLHIGPLDGVHWVWLLAVGIGLLVIGIPVGNSAVKKSQNGDPQWFVLDEACGVALALAGQWALFPDVSPWIVGAVVVVLFRVFDILKPPPVRQLESLPGGAGIMLDDAAAGVMAWVCGTLLLLAATAIWA